MTDSHYRKGDAFLESALEIFHKICTKWPYFAATYEGGRSGRARLRKMLMDTRDKETFKSFKSPEDLVQAVVESLDVFANKQLFNSSHPNYWKLLIKRGWTDVLGPEGRFKLWKTAGFPIQDYMKEYNK